MTRLLNATDICTRALRMIGAFPTSESAPEGEDLQEALNWLDLIMGEMAGTAYLFSFVPATIFVPIVNGAAVLPVPINNSLMGTVAFPTEAFLVRPGGFCDAVTIVTRETFESVSAQAAIGQPRWVFVDRTPDPVIQLFPAIDAADPGVYQLGLVVQTEPPDVTPKGVANSQPTSTGHGFRAAWQRMLIYRLAADIGRGPVRTLPQGRLNDFRKEADIAFARLEVFDRQHDNEPPIAASYDIGDLREGFPRDYDRRLTW